MHFYKLQHKHHNQYKSQRQMPYLHYAYQLELHSHLEYFCIFLQCVGRHMELDEVHPSRASPTFRVPISAALCQQSSLVVFANVTRVIVTVVHLKAGTL